jgi:hypothetical protein
MILISSCVFQTNGACRARRAVSSGNASSDCACCVKRKNLTCKMIARNAAPAAVGESLHNQIH